MSRMVMRKRENGIPQVKRWEGLRDWLLVGGPIDRKVSRKVGVMTVSRHTSAKAPAPCEPLKIM